MKSFASLTLFSLTAAATLASAALTPSRTQSTARHAEQLQAAARDTARGDMAAYNRAFEPVTNAKRMARGLPPLKPRRRGAHTARDAASSTPAQLTQRCNIAVTSLTTGNSLGFMNRQTANYIFYDFLSATQTAADTMIVSFGYTPGQVSRGLDLRVENPATAFMNYFGAIAYQGQSASIAAGAQVAPATQSSGFESAVWTYEPASGNIGALWYDPASGTTIDYGIYYLGGAYGRLKIGQVC
ncbi:unnamed protein product [Mycena citricolor]|uniref:Uncharacterized protein n=1 Tax=Mycena citricolor TaxID=2018698 RepID=A0AAD2JZL7_9AGAR|nr:unnamed protein product [Mycena citricolor]